MQCEQRLVIRWCLHPTNETWIAPVPIIGIPYQVVAIPILPSPFIPLAPSRTLMAFICPLWYSSSYPDPGIYPSVCLFPTTPLFPPSPPPNNMYSVPTLVFLLFFSSLTAAVNLTRCLEDFRSDPNSIGGIDSRGHPTNPAEAVGLSPLQAEIDDL